MMIQGIQQRPWVFIVIVGVQSQEWCLLLRRGNAGSGEQQEQGNKPQLWRNSAENPKPLRMILLETESPLSTQGWFEICHGLISDNVRPESRQNIIMSLRRRLAKGG